jgi:hypothetical protein
MKTGRWRVFLVGKTSILGVALAAMLVVIVALAQWPPQKKTRDVQRIIKIVEKEWFTKAEKALLEIF